MAHFIGTKYGIFTNSGSSANLLAVSALTSPLLKERQLKPGDRVITTACGFPTTLNPIIQNQLVPLFVDIKLGTYNIDTEKLKEAVTKKTKAIVVPHTLGNPADMVTINDVATDHKLWVIEDNCDTLGSTYHGHKTGSFGDISTCSFFPAHIISTGEGGMVLTSNPLLRKIVLSFRDWGRDCWCDTGSDGSCKNRFGQQHGNLPPGYDHKYTYSAVGYNLKSTEMCAAIGCAQLEKLPGFIKRRKENFTMLYDGLKQYQKYLDLPQAEPLSDPSWFGFPIRVISGNTPFTRNELAKYLEEHKIATRNLFGGNLIRQSAYANTKYELYGDLKNTDIVMNDLLWIGVYPGLEKEMIDYELSVFKKFFEERK
jgi:CDP-4-dehydro-6-deoxyglucose reductase, E1